MNKIQAYTNFWNSFNLTAYDEGCVPDKANLPYITFNIGEDDFNYPVSLTASIWYRSSNWVDITNKADEISDKISRGGTVVNYDDGALWIKKGTPFMQRVKDPDDSIRRIFMNIDVEFIN